MAIKTATRQNVRDAYLTYIGREPTEIEYTHHIGKTGLDHLNEWAMKQTREDSSTPTPTPTPTKTSTPTTIEGSTRINPQTGKKETYSPDGTWKETDVIIDTSNKGALAVTNEVKINETGYGELTDNQLWEYWQEIRENTEGGGIGPKLYEIYSKREDLQEIYDANGNPIPGKGAEGFTLQHWAMEFGWKESPELVMYKPENVVRSTYRFPFRGNDPLAAATFDEGAIDWINSIRNRQVTTIDGLLGRMKLDTGSEWSNLSDTQKTALTIDAYIPPEGLADIPKFGDFFNEEKEKTNIEDWVNEVYNKQLDDFLVGKEIEEKRTIEDWETITKQLDEDEEKDLTDAQRRFRQSLKQATEGYASAGLTYSSIREEGEGSIREGLGLEKEGITTTKQRTEALATKTKKRTLEDVAREKAAERERIRVAKIEEKTGRLTQKRGEELTKYQTLKSGVITPEEAGVK